MNSISEKISKRVCDHMNKDHMDSVHKYLNHYMNIYDFKEAKMVEIQSQFMTIMYDNKLATINFQKEISEEEIHNTLVKMIKAAN
mgnify:CR=1 FL=1|tara:strand:+ start:971 stop:1225 length:255 start_codon:yes stop_codon:yes gene_type:complete